MKNMQSSLEVEEKFVDGAIESLESLPTATNTHELDVSIWVLLVRPEGEEVEEKALQSRTVHIPLLIQYVLYFL